MWIFQYKRVLLYLYKTIVGHEQAFTPAIVFAFSVLFCNKKEWIIIQSSKIVLVKYAHACF